MTKAQLYGGPHDGRVVALTEALPRLRIPCMPEVQMINTKLTMYTVLDCWEYERITWSYTKQHWKYRYVGKIPEPRTHPTPGA